MTKRIETSVSLLRTGQKVDFGEGKAQGTIRSIKVRIELEGGMVILRDHWAAVTVIDDDPELCPNGQPWGTECREIDPCEMCQQDLDEEGDKIEASMGLRESVVEDDDEDDEPESDGRCHGCEGTCCTGVNGIPCSC